MAEQATEQFRELGDLLQGRVLDCLERFQKDELDDRQLAIVCTYFSIVEHSQVALLLVHEGHGFFAFSTLRSQLEAYCNLCSLIEKPDYLLQLQLKDLEERERLLIEMGEGNPYIHSDTSFIDPHSELDALREEKGRIKKLGFGKLFQSTKFDIAGAALEGKVLVPILSDHVHMGLQALRDRHLSLPSGRIEVSLFKEHPLERFDNVLGVTHEVLQHASRRFHEHFETGFADRFLA